MVRRSAARNLAFLRDNVLTELSVNLGRVADLTAPQELGLAREELTGPDFAVCHTLARVARATGCDGLLVLSAAMSGTNLDILPENLSQPVSLQVLSSVELPLGTIERENPGGGGV